MDWQKPDIPEKYRKLYEKGRAGSPKAAIRLHCLMCVAWEPAEVEACTATGCPLYTLRNLAAQAQTESADREKRRKRALASGRRPPKRPAADGRGAHAEAPILDAAEVSRRSMPCRSGFGPTADGESLAL
jgi:hypothetical protein